MTCVFCIDVDTIIWLFVCEDVGPRRHEVELMRASTRQEPGRLLWEGERRQHEDAEARPSSDERAVRRCRFDDPGAEPSHAPLVEVGGDFKDIRHHLEAVL
jgi:hypothetical protein